MKILIIILASATIFVTVIFGVSMYMTSSTTDKTYSSLETIPYNRVGLLLGVDKYTESGYVNLYYQSRLAAAIELYNAGKIERILVSGDNSREGYDEPTTFKLDLVEAGIPEAYIYLDYAGFRTRDSIIRAHKVFELDSFTVISQEFHNERALYIAKQFELDVVGYNARPIIGIHSRKTNLREYAARMKAVIDVLFGKQSKFLGKTVEIQ